MAMFLNMLLGKNVIDKQSYHELRKLHNVTKRPIVELLVEKGLREDELLKLMSDATNIPLIDLQKITIDYHSIKLLPYKTAKMYNVFPVGHEDHCLILAVNNPLDIIALDDIKNITNMKIRLALASGKEIARCIDRYYNPFDDTLRIFLKYPEYDVKIENIQNDISADESHHVLPSVEELKNEDSPVVRLANIILSEAIRARATDIHIDPQEDYVDIKYRVDGVLRRVMKIQNKFRSSLVARLKILSSLDIAETKKPQDGRTQVSINERKIDLRISVIPTFYGEKAALRLLDSKEVRTGLLEIGLNNKERKIFTKAVTRPQGIILSTGPTGSGKTSTMYAALNFLAKSETKNIITIEDPIEYTTKGISQMQVNPVKGITFAKGLRHILRQDPNIILVGEIRDKETADIAFQSSLTGHLVLSTLHTNNSVASITRLIDIGLEPYLISSALTLIVAQRLVRVVCPDCKEEYIPDERLLYNFRKYIDEYEIRKFYRGKGCEKCDFMGYFGRTAIFEIMEVDDRIKYLITRNSPEDVIMAQAVKNGLKTLAASGIAKVAMALTTLEEIVHVTEGMDECRMPDKSRVNGDNAPEPSGEETERFLKSLEKQFSKEPDDETGDN